MKVYTYSDGTYQYILVANSLNIAAELLNVTPFRIKKRGGMRKLGNPNFLVAEKNPGVVFSKKILNEDGHYNDGDWERK
jgi:hypothetical protein